MLETNTISQLYRCMASIEKKPANGDRKIGA